MKIIFVLIVSFGSLRVIASDSHQCDFSAKIEKLGSDSSKSIEVKVLFTSRSFKTWMFGGSVCKKAVGKAFFTLVPATDEYLKELEPVASKNITAFLICSEEEPGCFWGWHSYKLIEQ